MALDDHLDPTPRTFSDWLERQLDRDQVEDLARYGAAAGWPGLTYYTETGQLYERYHEEVWDALAEDADDFGYPTIPEYLASFPIARQVTDDATFRNALVWYLAERTAQRLTDDS